LKRIGGTTNDIKKEPKKTVEAAPVLLANTWEGENLTDYFLSEKLDGVRCYWDGKQMLSRNGNKYYAPKWFVNNFPNEPLDGELWLARKSFQTTSSIVRRQDGSGDWNRIKYIVFDAPAQKTPFEQRMKFLYELSLPKTAEILPQIQCKGSEQLP
jgi:DNA ligase-1